MRIPQVTSVRNQLKRLEKAEELEMRGFDGPLAVSENHCYGTVTVNWVVELTLELLCSAALMVKV
jgi:hypothetical protein